MYHPFRDTITEIQSPLLDKTSPFHIDETTGKRLNKTMKIALKTAKLDPRFPRAKYINVVKLNESKRKWSAHGIASVVKIYSIGVLTTDNHYYYSELRTNSNAITKPLTIKMGKIFNGYVITNETKITLSTDISKKDEPIELYLSIVGNITGAVISRVPYLKQIRRINKTFQYIRPYGKQKYTKTSHIVIQQHGVLVKKLIKNNRFDFLTGDNDFIHNQEKYTKEDFNRHLMTAMGILYMFAKEQNRRYDMKYKKRREELKKIQENQNGYQ